MYAGTVAVPLILGSALHLAPAQVGGADQRGSLTSGLATLLQDARYMEVGARLPLVQGCFVHLRPRRWS